MAQSVQLVLEYAPDPPFEAGRPEIAPARIRAAVSVQMDALLGDGRKRLEGFASGMQ